jgi:probable HAF family extracellular repeat protein
MKQAACPTRLTFILPITRAAICWLATFATAHAEIRYAVTDLGSLGGEPYAYDVNDFGEVTGISFTLQQGQFHAYLWTPTQPNGSSGQMQDLGALTGSASWGNGINDAGQVTGNVLLGPGLTRHLFVYDGTMHDLGAGSAGFGAAGFGINNSGQITGSLRVDANGDQHAMIYDSTFHDLGTLGGTNSLGQSINASGQVTGYSDNSGNLAWNAFFYDGTMHNIGTLGGAFSIGNDINDGGKIVGYSDVTGSNNLTVFHAFLYDGVLHDLGTLGGTKSDALGINQKDQVVGFSYISGDSVTHAFLCTALSEMVDLNTLIDPAAGWVLTDAYAINDVGQIVGQGYAGGQTRAFLLTPVPEPSTFALAALGAAALYLARRVGAQRKAPRL